MKLAIMQPYFFPYLGYFDLINYSNKFIVFDTVQYIERGWMNRNRIIEPNKGWQYIKLPLKKHARNIKINEVIISDSQPWVERFFSLLLCYKKKAPYYSSTKNLLESCLDCDSVLLSEINIHSLDLICKYLGINFDYQFFSKMDMKIGSVDKPDEWALHISESLVVDEYVNLPGGSAIFSFDDFQHKDINLILRKIPTYQYKTATYDFISNLSIIDVLMWNSPEEIKCYLDSVKSTKFNMKENETSN